MNRQAAGFREIDHTADWALEIWAPDLAGLFGQAILGMNMLTQVVLSPENRITRELEFTAADPESLLVTFLSELVYIGEEEDIGFDHLKINIEGIHLTARLEGAKIKERMKEIKAVTYHNLEIISGPRGLQAQLVFDV